MEKQIITNEERFKKGLKEFLEGWNADVEVDLSIESDKGIVVTLREIYDHEKDTMVQSFEEFEIDFSDLGEN